MVTAPKRISGLCMISPFISVWHSMTAYNKGFPVFSIATEAAGDGAHPALVICSTTQRLPSVIAMDYTPGGVVMGQPQTAQVALGLPPVPAAMGDKDIPGLNRPRKHPRMGSAPRRRLHDVSGQALSF